MMAYMSDAGEREQFRETDGAFWYRCTLSDGRVTTITVPK